MADVTISVFTDSGRALTLKLFDLTTGLPVGADVALSEVAASGRYNGTLTDPAAADYIAHVRASGLPADDPLLMGFVRIESGLSETQLLSALPGSGASATVTVEHFTAAALAELAALAVQSIAVESEPEQRCDPNHVVVYTGEVRPVEWMITAGGEPLDLAGKTLQLVIQDHRGVARAAIDQPGLNVVGNVVSPVIGPGVTDGEPFVGLWSLRDVTNPAFNVRLADGIFEVRRTATAA